MDFFWFLRRDDRPPPPLEGVFSGGCHWDFGRLAEMDEQVRWLSRNAFVEDTAEERLWRTAFPFHDISTGDFLAIDVSSSGSQPVIYLCHELDWSHGHVLGADFFDFMDRWTAIGCPDDDIWPLFVPDKTKSIDLDHANVMLWTEWFGLPPPR